MACRTSIVTWKISQRTLVRPSAVQTEGIQQLSNEPLALGSLDDDTAQPKFAIPSLGTGIRAGFRGSQRKLLTPNSIQAQMIQKLSNEPIALEGLDDDTAQPKCDIPSLDTESRTGFKH